MKALAHFDNVYCKLSGMVTEADWKNWKPEHFAPYLDLTLESFGSQRVMYGSDWPVCLLAGSYDRVLGLAQDYVRQLGTDAEAKFFGANAARFYGLT